MTLYIKNMVCNRCILVVQQELEKQGLHPQKVSLGEVSLEESHLDDTQLSRLDTSLVTLGFERIDDRKARLIESIKNIVIQKIHRAESVNLKFNWIGEPKVQLVNDAFRRIECGLQPLEQSILFGGGYYIGTIHHSPKN